MRIRGVRKPSAGIPLSSTADIAFLLLIFFIVLAKGTNESAIDWKPATTVVKLDAADGSLVSVTIDKHKKIYINGFAVPSSAVKDAIDASLGDLPQGQRKVLLKIDKTVPEKVFGPVMLDIADAGADIFRVLEPDEAKQKL